MIITFFNCLVLLINRKSITKENPGYKVWTSSVTESWGILLAFILVAVFFVCLLECMERMSVKRNGKKSDKFAWGAAGFFWGMLSGCFNVLIFTTTRDLTMYLILGIVISLIVTLGEIVYFSKDAIEECDSILAGIARGIGFEVYMILWAIGGILMFALFCTPLVIVTFIFAKSEADSRL